MNDEMDSLVTEKEFNEALASWRIERARRVKMNDAPRLRIIQNVISEASQFFPLVFRDRLSGELTSNRQLAFIYISVGRESLPCVGVVMRNHGGVWEIETPTKKEFHVCWHEDKRVSYMSFMEAWDAAEHPNLLRPVPVSSFLETWDSGLVVRLPADIAAYFKNPEAVIEALQRVMDNQDEEQKAA